MPVNVRLSDDNTHLLYTMEDPIEMSELMQAYEQERALRDSKNYTLHSIVDMTQVKGIPRNWLTAKAGPGLTHPRSGYILFVGISPGLRIIVQTILKIVRYDRMQFFANREDAHEYLMAMVEDRTLPESPLR